MEKRERKIFWEIYYYLILILFVFAAFFALINLSFFILLSLCFFGISFTAMHGYVFNAKIFDRSFWLVWSWIVGTILALSFLSLIFALSGATIVSFIFTIPLLPMYVSVFSYASINNAVWGEKKNDPRLDKLDKALSDNKPFTKTKVISAEPNENKIMVELSKDNNVYRVEIVWKYSGKEEVTRKVFNSLESAIRYVSSKTLIEESDFFSDSLSES